MTWGPCSGCGQGADAPGRGGDRAWWQTGASSRQPMAAILWSVGFILRTREGSGGILSRLVKLNCR